MDRLPWVWGPELCAIIEVFGVVAPGFWGGLFRSGVWSSARLLRYSRRSTPGVWGALFRSDDAVKMATKPHELRKRINEGKPDLALVQSDDGL